MCVHRYTRTSVVPARPSSLDFGCCFKKWECFGVKFCHFFTRRTPKQRMANPRKQTCHKKTLSTMFKLRNCAHKSCLGQGAVMGEGLSQKVSFLASLM